MNQIVVAPTVLDLIGPERLGRLREHFSEGELCRLARASAVKRYPDGGGWGTFLVDHFFQPGATPWEPGQREQVLVAVLAIQTQGQGRWLAIHLYWSLMYLEPRTVAETLLLAASYSGIHVYNSAMETLERTLRVLDGLAEAPAAPDISAVYAALVAAFG